MLNVIYLLEIEEQYLFIVKLWDDCTFARKRYTNLVHLPLSLSTPTYGNSASIRPMLYSKREKYYSAKRLGDRLQAALHKMPEELGNSFCLFLKS